MAFIPVPNTALVEIKFLMGTSIVENTLYFENSTSPTEGMLEDLATACAAAWGSNQSTLQTSDVSLFEVKATSLVSDSAPTFTYTVIPPVAGSAAANRTPGNVSWAIQFRTAARGRSYRGRNYWIGLNEGLVSGDGITSTLANDIVQSYIDFMAEVETDGWDHVVVSRYTNGAARVAGVTTPVTSYGYADLWVDSQRRRLTGRGG